jgi:hypothetical protein
MRITLKSGLLIAGLAVSGGALSANEGAGHMTVEQKIEKLRTQLNLTPGQAANVQAILEEQKAKLDSATSEEDRKSVKDETHQRIKALLTDEQAAKYDRMKEEWKKDKGSKKPGTAEPAPATGSH